MRIAITVLAFALFTLLSGCTKPEATTIAPQDVSTEKIPQPASVQSGEQEITFEPPTGQITLKDAAAAAIVGSPKLKAFEIDTRISEARQIQASAKPDPELEIELENFGGSGDFSGFDSAETTIAISQVIELGGKLEKRKNVASLETELARLDYTAAKLDVLTELTISFINAAELQKKADMLKELVKLADDVHEKVRKLVQAGKGTAVDEAKSAIEVSSVKMDYNQTLRELELSKKMLTSHWASDQVTFDRLEADFTITQAMPNFNHLKQLMANSPHLTRLQAEITKNKAVADMEKAYTKPDITIGAGVKTFNDSDDQAFVFGVSIPLPISQANRGQRLEAAHNLAKSYEQNKQQQIELNNAFSEVQAQITSSILLARELADTIVPQTKQILEATQKAYAQGKANYIEVLDAQRQYLEKQTEHIEAAASYHRSIALIEGLTGQILQTTSVDQ